MHEPDFTGTKSLNRRAARFGVIWLVGMTAFLAAVPKIYELIRRMM